MISPKTLQRIAEAAKRMNGATVPEIADVCDVHKRTAGRVVAQLVRDGVIYTALIAREGRGVHTIFHDKAEAEATRKLWDDEMKARLRKRARDRQARCRARPENVEKRIKAAEARCAKEAEEKRRAEAKTRTRLEQKAARKAELDNRAAERLRARVAKPTTAAVHVAVGKGPAYLPGEPDTSKAKITRLPSHPGRFEHQGRVLDGFSSMKPGCYELPANSCAAKRVAA